MKPSHAGFWKRFASGSRWTWFNPRYRSALPPDIAESVMKIESSDRLHAKQGRSTARVIFHGPDGPLSVYLKRHYRLPILDRIAALIHPGAGQTPGGAEFQHLGRARELGIAVPEVVAAGETIGPWGALQSFLMVAELTGRTALNEIADELCQRLGPLAFERLKRELAREMAEITARLHGARVVHKDLYLCHFFIDPTWTTQSEGERLTLIDLHRLGSPRWFFERWRAKDLGQLLYSIDGIACVHPRDALRFWVHYQRRLKLKTPRVRLKMAAWKAARYRNHNR